ncbi:putative lipoprotein, borrelia PFam52 protein (plasmid) [Borreliella bissettiae DN127]|uniref:Lipoprotein, borrelia PFam52 protein n=1 Tax=Borrelia bissettiae (strain DSM 17990 / CIP 109136 / DN127) TaxID=521010 RepID=G0AP66_BORBD|nr:S2/P23 family protein [Borreliella bissettiae]AEL19492.1 putative lipoprotein, borrelia PFam52 protein [Borreliella bissettiae DN127]
MKKDIRILNIFLYIPLFYSCFLTPPKSSKINKIKNPDFDFKKIEEENITKYNKDTIKDSNKNICLSLEEPESNKIKEGEVFEPLAVGYVTWAKSGNLKALKDKNNNLIEDLRELKYSYIFSPIQFKTYSFYSFSFNYGINDNNYKILGQEVPIAKIIAFESTIEFEKKYEIKSLKLNSEESNIDFEQNRTGLAKINLKENSKEPNYIYSYNFGVFDNSLADYFKFFYKKSNCNYMPAYLTIKDKQTDKDKTYEIILNLKLFNDAIKLLFDKYSNLSKEKLKLFIDE